MQKGWLITALMTALLLNLVLSPTSGAPSRDDEGARAPVLKAEGHITSDQSWSGQFRTHNIVIEQNVTVTVNAGAEWFVPANSFIFIEGTLVLKGTKTDHVTITELGLDMGWNGIDVNSTGRVLAENLTVSKVHDSASIITNSGRPSILKNGIMMNGSIAFETLTSKGGHLIENITFDHQDISVLLRQNSLETTVRDCSFSQNGWGFIAMLVSSNVSLERLHGEGTGYGYGASASSNIRFIDCHFTNSTMVPYPALRGFWLEYYVQGLGIIGGSIENAEQGIFGNDYSASDFKAEGLSIGPTVSHALYLDIAPGSFPVDCELIDCDLRSPSNTTYVRNPTAAVHIDLINTTYDPASRFTIDGDTIVNVSYFADVDVRNNAGKPLSSHLTIERSGSSVYDSILPDGRARKVPLLNMSIDPYGRKSYLHNLYVEAVDPDTDATEELGVRITGYTQKVYTINLRPFNSLPGLSFEEDGKLDCDLYGNFTDPDGQEFDWDISTGPEIDARLVQGHKVLRVTTTQENWYGPSWLRVVATDPGGKWTEANVSVTVGSVNDAPYLTQALPLLEVEEDHRTFVNLTGLVMDVEGDDVTVGPKEGDGYTFLFDEAALNITIVPDPDVNGMLMVPIELSDGKDTTTLDLQVEVVPVNDPPIAVPRFMNGTLLPIEEETEGSFHYVMELEEDLPVWFWIDAFDIEGGPLSYFNSENVMNGDLERETYLDGSNEIIIPMNFTYSPHPDDTDGDMVSFSVSDGNLSAVFDIEFTVRPINDPPVLHIPNNGTIKVDRYVESRINVSGWATDVDGDIVFPSIGADPYVKQIGSTLIARFDNSLRSSTYSIPVHANDGKVNVSKNVTFIISGGIPPIISIERVEVVPKEDGWDFNAYGPEGQTIYLIIEDEEGQRTTLDMTYKDGMYTVFIPDEVAEKGVKVYISDREGGDEIIPTLTETLPELKGKTPGEYLDPLFCCLIGTGTIIAILLLMVIIVLVIRRKKRGPEDGWEE